MRRLLSFALLATAFPLFATASLARPCPLARDGFEAERAAAVKELLAGLETYVDWCSGKKLWVERNRGLEAILAIDPGNMSAKRGLGWQQVADGVWEPPKEPKPAKNFDPGALKEAPARYADAIRPWRDHLVQLIESHKAELSMVQRDGAFEEILAVEPNDTFVRAALGEERSDKGWVLSETVRAKTRRAEIREIVKQALAQAPPAKDFVLNANDPQSKIDWKVSVATERVRVLSTGDRAEALHIAQVLHAERDVFQKIFGVSTDLGQDFTIYLPCDPTSKKAFIANLPDLSDAQRSFYEHVDGTGLIGSNSAAWWSSAAERRLDGVTRHGIGAMFQVEFGLTVEAAWAWEGFGLYLTREMIGSRLTWYIVPVEENQSGAAKKVGVDWMKKLLTPGTNWMNEGYRLVRAGDASSLASTLARPLNKMTPQDLFVSYVVAAYLLEGQAQRLPDMLRRLGSKNGAPQKAVQVWPGVLAMELGVFVPRFERWLGERR